MAVAWCAAASIVGTNNNSVEIPNINCNTAICINAFTALPILLGSSNFRTLSQYTIIETNVIKVSIR